MATDRDFDIVLLGATGFTGGLTADYLAEHAPDGLRWALAGRDSGRLEAVRDRLVGEQPRWADLPLLHADVTEPASLVDVARRARVVITTVGPYIEYGEPLVAACAEAGTDYVDLTGEAEFVDRMWVAHHATAERSGARLVHSCGLDSIPHDLGALYTVQQLPDDEPITMRGVVRSNGTFSGGTYQTAIIGMSRVRHIREASAARRRAEPGPVGRSSKAVSGKPHRDHELGYWLLPLPTIDPLVVARSGAVLPAYGPRFRYSHYAGTKSLRYAVGGAAVVSAVSLAAQVGPLRSLLLGRMQPGEGPSEARRAKSWFTVDLVGEAGGRTVHTRVSGGDGGYSDSAMMLSEAALSLALDDNPETAGQVTTAVAMGAHLTDRVQRGGLRFEVC